MIIAGINIPIVEITLILQAATIAWLYSIVKSHKAKKKKRITLKDIKKEYTRAAQFLKKASKDLKK